MEFKAGKVSGRNDTADIFKAICIFFVIIGHAPLCNNEVKRYLYSFHMPAFFLIYGLLYNVEKHESRGFLTKKFLVEKMTRLLIPCYVCGLVYSLLSSTGINIRTLPLILWGSQRSFALADSLTSLWFLPCMFISTIWFELMMTAGFQKCPLYIKVVILLALAALSVLLPVFKYGYPLCIDVSLMGILFIILGRESLPVIKGLTSSKTPSLVGMAIAATLICFYLNKLNLNFISINNADMAGRYYGSIVIYLICGCLGSFSVCVIAELIVRSKLSALKKVLSFIGRHTLFVLMVHKPMVIYACKVLSILPFMKSVVGLLAAICVYCLTLILMKVIQKTVGEFALL